MSTPPVGDINSNAKGTGARYNAGKPAVELILWRPASRLMRLGKGKDAIIQLGWFQETHNIRFLLDLVISLYGTDNRLALFEAAKVFAFGATKYKAWNWAKGMAWSVPVACIARHLLAIDADEENDPESGLPHRGHVVCNVLMLLAYQDTYREGNDLPTLFLPKDKPNNGQKIAADFFAFGTGAGRVTADGVIHIPLRDFTPVDLHGTIDDGAFPLHPDDKPLPTDGFFSRDH